MSRFLTFGGKKKSRKLSVWRVSMTLTQKETESPSVPSGTNQGRDLAVVSHLPQVTEVDRWQELIGKLMRSQKSSLDSGVSVWTEWAEGVVQVQKGQSEGSALSGADARGTNEKSVKGQLLFGQKWCGLIHISHYDAFSQFLLFHPHWTSQSSIQ